MKFSTSFIALALLSLSILGRCHGDDASEELSEELREETGRTEARARYYSRSPFHLLSLELMELPIARDLALALPRLPPDSAPRRIAQEYLQDYEESTSASVGGRRTAAADNPICAYRLIRRITHYFRSMKQHDTLARILRPATEDFARSSWPQQADIDDAIEGILRLQLVHGFSIAEFSQGRIGGDWTNCTLNSAHCYEIAFWAGMHQKWAFGVEWLELAKSKALYDGRMELGLVESTLWTAIEWHNIAHDYSDDWDFDFFMDKLEHGTQENRLKRRTMYLELGRERSWNYSAMTYWSLCSGETFQTAAEQSVLFCWLEFRIHPSLAISPMRMELLSRDPDVVQMYGVLREEEMLEICNRSGPSLNASQVINSHDSDTFIAKARTSVTSAELGRDGQLLRQSVVRRIERLTGLDSGEFGAAHPASAEMLQMTSYTFVGHSLPHSDALQSETITSGSGGDRIATFMIYLNSVEKGGLTAFNGLGLAARPIKGSAIFWFNILPTGMEDLDTSHGGCPVLLGSKWVAIKWIRLYDQFLAQKCGLDQRQRFRYPINGLVE